jgi:peptide/nickel transport system substrate-binding protein
VQGVNVDQLIDDAAGGRGVRADSGIPPGSWADSQPEVRGFDPGGAASALEIAGWSRGRDGIRRKGNLRLAFTLSTSNDPRRVAIVENVARQWRALGASVEVQPLAASTYIDEYLVGRQFVAALAEIDPGPDPDPYPFWHTTQIAPPGRNFASFSDAQVDDWLERARQNTETARRLELYQSFENAIVQAAPALPLFHPVHVYAQDRRAQGFEPTLLSAPANRFHNVHEWYVRTRVERD